MNEAALYALEHIEITAEIRNAIPDMEKLVFKGFDSAVKESISDWFGGDWQCDEYENLMDGVIYLYYRKDDPDWDKVYIALAFGDSGKGKNIWTFLGKNSPLGSDDYFIWLATTTDEDEAQVSKPQNNKMFEMKEIRALTKHGFKIRQYNGYFWLQKTISFNSEDILKGLKSEGWKSALSPLKKAWQPLVDLDWDEISKCFPST